MNRPDCPKGGGVEDRNQAERVRSPGDETRRVQRVVRLGGAVKRDSDELQPRGWVFRVAAGGDGDRGGRAGEQPFADRPGAIVPRSVTDNVATPSPVNSNTLPTPPRTPWRRNSSRITSFD
jgi:hypothetical protein